MAMAIRVITTKKFKKKFENLSPKIKLIFQEKMLFLSQNQYHPGLNHHKLKGSNIGLCSINITGDIRLIMEEAEPSIFVLLDIDNHNNLYGN